VLNNHRISKLLDDARYYEDHRMWLHAVQVYERLIHELPAEWKYRVRLGNVYLEMGNLNAAEQVLLQALRYDNQNPDVLYTLGLAAYQGEDYTRALYYLEQLAARNIPKVHYSLGLVHWRRAEFSHAERHFRLAVELDPESADAALALGETLLRNENARDAIEPLRRAARLRPDDAVITHALGLALSRIGQHQDAVPLYEALLHRDPDDRNATLALANALVSLNQIDAAESILLKATLRSNNDARLFVMLGRLSLQRANRSRAEDFFRRALTIDPDQLDALEQLRYLAPHGNPAI
jgi:tetratricopeptide (TPR) repeat protein